MDSVRFGAWRSSVARLSGGQKVAGSNPVAPTIMYELYIVISIPYRVSCKVFFIESEIIPLYKVPSKND